MSNRNPKKSNAETSLRIGRAQRPRQGGRGGRGERGQREQEAAQAATAHVPSGPVGELPSAPPQQQPPLEEQLEEMKLSSPPPPAPISSTMVISPVTTSFPSRPPNLHTSGLCNHHGRLSPECQYLLDNPNGSKHLRPYGVYQVYNRSQW